jgi:hypothetical protein
MRNPTLAMCLISLAAWAWPLAAGAANGSVFVSQNVPANVTAGASFVAEVTFQNSGTTVWTPAAGYYLGSQNPMDNTTWGTNRFSMAAPDSVAAGATYTFTATLTAPAAVGDFNFQWQVLQDAVEWFGASTPNVVIHVAAAPAMTCDGTEKLCLTLTDQAQIVAAGGTVGGDVNAEGFLPADQGGLDWHFGPGVDLSAGRLVVDVKGLLPQTDPGQPEQVSVFEVCGEGPDTNQVVGLQRMMLGYHGNNIFRYYATTDFASLGWQLGVWTDGFEATGWTASQTHHFDISWTSGSGGAASIALTIDGVSWNNTGTLPFFAPNKLFTLGARCPHYPMQQAVARFSNFKLWVLGKCGNGTVDPGEACDGNCPASCDDSNACTADALTGSAVACTEACTHSTITSCASGDGCCPSGCSASADDDCPVVPPADAGPSADAGPEADAGTAEDAGTESDAGTASDAGPQAELDAGPRASPVPVQGSCGCAEAQTVTAAAQLLWLWLAAAGWRRRR